MTLSNSLTKEYQQLSLWYFASFIFGIASYFFLLWHYQIIVTATVLVALLKLYDYFKPLNITYKFVIYLLISFLLGNIISYHRIAQVTNLGINIQNPAVSTITGKVTHIKPTIRGRQFTIGKLSNLHTKGMTKVAQQQLLNSWQQHQAKIRIIIKNQNSKNLQVGDVIQMRVKLYPLGGRILPDSFDFGFFMSMQKIAATGYALSIPKIIESADSNSWHSFIQNLRLQIYQKLLSNMPTDSANFAAAILIGETKAIQPKIADDMRISGVAHILSVSGLHLSLAAIIFFTFSRALLNCSNFLAYNYHIKNIAAIIAILGSLLYLQISGSNIAAIRAFIMTTIVMLAVILGRHLHLMRLILLAATIMLCFMPEYVLHPSFQLSFAAVISLIAGYEFYTHHTATTSSMQKIFGRISNYFALNIYSSLIASIATAPFIIFHFYKFANYSVLMNLLAVPLMSFVIMPLGILGLFLMPFGLEQPILSILVLAINIIIKAAAYVADLPNAALNYGHMPVMTLAIFILGFIWLYFWQTRWRLLGMVIICVNIGIMMLAKRPIFIYDYSGQVVAVAQSQTLTIYASKPLSSFAQNYWQNWFAIPDFKYINCDITQDQSFTAAGKIIALANNQCIPADILIITSPNLNCPVTEYQQVISYPQTLKQQIIIY